MVSVVSDYSGAGGIHMVPLTHNSPPIMPSTRVKKGPKVMLRCCILTPLKTHFLLVTPFAWRVSRVYTRARSNRGFGN